MTEKLSPKPPHQPAPMENESLQPHEPAAEQVSVRGQQTVPGHADLGANSYGGADAAARAAVDAFAATLSFPLDDFQVAACEIVAEGRGVLVCAPTGAGKTIVGEFAVARAVELGTKCFYTTPIKALSNQKYHDLCAIYGEGSVGLLTGDVSINGDADIVVMTTEVLRNMIYAGSFALQRLQFVVMDEIHFLADKDRGAVWEEVILNVDEDVAVIGLSATVSNSAEFGQWLSTVRGHTEVVVTNHRPIPLDQWMVVGHRMYPLFEAEEAPLERPTMRQEASRHAASHHAASRQVDAGSSGGSEEGRNLTAPLSIDDVAHRAGPTSEHDATASDDDSVNAHAVNRGLVNAVQRAERSLERRGSDGRSQRFGGDSSRRARPGGPLTRPEMLELLARDNMLPVIDFIFSRAGCDKALVQCARSRLTMTTQQEAARIAEIIDRGVESIPEEDLKVLGFRQWRSTLMRGFAAHHAGMLPAFRHIVEELFVQGLLKAVFATETLALGINMPARTVFIERLVKFNGDGFADLTPGQYTQLTGRAGRRGIDTIGNAVVAWEPGVEPEHVAGLASLRSYPLVSTFAPGYNMTVNLLATMGYTQGRNLIERSFAQFQLNKDVVGDAQREDKLARKISHAKKDLAHEVAPLLGHNGLPNSVEALVDEVVDYVGLRQSLSAQEKSDKRRAVSERRKEVEALLRRAALGDIIALPGKKTPILACVVESSWGGSPAITIVTEQGWMGRIHADELALPPITLGSMYIPTHKRNRGRRDAAGAIAHALRQELAVQGIRRPKRLKNTVKVRPSQQAKALREQVSNHPLHRLAQVEQLARTANQIARWETERRTLQEQMDSSQNSLGRTFDRIVDLLQHLGYVEPAGDTVDADTIIGVANTGDVAAPAAAHPDNAHPTPALNTPDDGNAARESASPRQATTGTMFVPTEEGQRLARIHNSHDLLIAELLRRGIFDGLDPAELAAAISQCTYESRKDGDVNLAAAAASDAVLDAFHRTLSVWEELVWEETHRGLEPTAKPDAGFALAIHQWAAGGPLGYCLAAANQLGAQMTPGDFVRQCRQVVDALDQVADTGYSDTIVRAARQAREAIRRGVVALGM